MLRNDLISRQAAIELIEEYIDEYSDTDEKGLHNGKWCAMQEAKFVLNELPSAKQWIPCSERLPEKQLFINTHEKSESSEYVLVTIKMYNNPFCDFIIRVARYDYVRNRWIILNANAEYIKVTAWCPLPEPYVEVEDNE